MEIGDFLTNNVSEVSTWGSAIPLRHEIDQIYLQMDGCKRIFARSAKILHIFSRKLADLPKISIKSKIFIGLVGVHWEISGGVQYPCTPPLRPRLPLVVPVIWLTLKSVTSANAVVQDASRVLRGMRTSRTWFAIRTNLATSFNAQSIIDAVFIALDYATSQDNYTWLYQGLLEIAENSLTLT